MSDTKVLAFLLALPASRLLTGGLPSACECVLHQDGLGPTHMTPLHLEYLKTVFPHTVPF